MGSSRVILVRVVASGAKAVWRRWRVRLWEDRGWSRRGGGSEGLQWEVLEVQRQRWTDPGSVSVLGNVASGGGTRGRTMLGCLSCVETARFRE